MFLTGFAIYVLESCPACWCSRLFAISPDILLPALSPVSDHAITHLISCCHRNTAGCSAAKLTRLPRLADVVGKLVAYFDLLRE
jgi:hypothetical protein